MIIVSEATELLLFENGELDWAGSPLSVIPTDAIERLKSEQTLQTFPLYGTSFFRFNIEKAPSLLQLIERWLENPLKQEKEKEKDWWPGMLRSVLP